MVRLANETVILHREKDVRVQNVQTHTNIEIQSQIFHCAASDATKQSKDK